MLLQLPGWLAKPAPDGLPLLEKWEAVRGARLPAPMQARSSVVAHPFALDSIHYQREVGERDHWQTPMESLKLGTGDCEDICLFERALFLNGKIPDEDLWLLIVYDLATRQDHALLWTPRYFLDCRNRTPMRHEQFSDYKPISAFAANQALSFERVG